MPIVVPRWSRGAPAPALLTGGNFAIACGRTGGCSVAISRSNTRNLGRQADYLFTLYCYYGGR
jgi:hypothetical protein